VQFNEMSTYQLYSLCFRLQSPQTLSGL
jgi:hypothetical protein